MGLPLREVPRFDHLSDAELAAVLESPNGVQRDMAQLAMTWRAGKASVPALRSLAEKGQRPTARLHALCCLDALHGLTDGLLLASLEDQDAGVRRHAIRLCEPRLNDAPQLGQRLLKLVDDDESQVRVQLAYTLGEWDDARAGTALGQLLIASGGDRFLRTAVLSSASGHLDQLIIAALKQRENADDRQADPALLEDLLGQAASENQELLARVAAALARPAGGEVYALWQFRAVGALLDTLSRRRLSLDQLQAEAPKSLQSDLARLEKLFTDARVYVADDRAPLPARIAAARLLGRGAMQRDEDAQRLAKLLAPQHALELQNAAATALGALRRDDTPQLLLRGWRSYSPRLRREVLAVLLSRRDWQAEVLSAIAAQRIASADLDAISRQRLLQSSEAGVRQRAGKLLGASGDSDRKRIVEKYRRLVASTGDVSRGAAVFEKTCAACHRLADKGFAIGPDLSALTDRSFDALLTAILDPNRAVEAKFVNYTAVTTDGLAYTGMLTTETSGSVTLAQGAGKQRQIPRADLEQLQSTGKSMMPEGLEKDLRPEDLANVIAFIAGANPPPKRFTGNQPEVVRPEALRGELWLLAANCEIYGKSLVFEPKYRNLGYWQSENDMAAWTIEVAQAGAYKVELDYACPRNLAGKRILLEVAGRKTTAEVRGTAGWGDYQRLDLGAVQLPSGRCRLILRSAGAISSALMDLKSVRLRPVRQ